MRDSKSVWRFDGAIAPIFDFHVKQSVPGYDRIQESVSELANFFCEDGAVVIDLGCATGESLARIQQVVKEKNLRLIGVDESSDMIQQAMKKTKGMSDFQFINEKIEDVKLPEDSSVVLSILTLQFVSQRHRKAVIKKVYESLGSGGVFILVEKTYSKSGCVQEAFTQLYHDFKEREGLDALEIRAKDKSLRGVMRPLTVAENESILKEVGFKNIEMFFRDLHFCGWLAFKEERDANEQ
ncbi:MULTISPECIES: methyltransferase domain-containing protein [unclassified Exiguobacterium]|uniref:methyltransferase domain-containing protein n=1 Tax=unclassified Exiguobacterium TaxID=2644629 RepID=UPI001BE8874C|nr:MULTISPECIES: methyltransferase domain-containing protein [unclassified Exiguobacterium]